MYKYCYSNADAINAKCLLPAAKTKLERAVVIEPSCSGAPFTIIETIRSEHQYDDDNFIIVCK